MSETIPEEGVWTEEHSNGYVHINLGTNTPAEHTHEEDVSEKDDTHTFPTALPDWSNCDVLHKNTLPPRASFVIYKNPSDALSRDVTKSKTLSLSGEYSFHLAQSPLEAPHFFQPAFDRSSWGSIKVPGMWQLQGYGKGPQ
jgi:beta-galactosidase